MGAISILYVPCLIMLRGVYDGKARLSLKEYLNNIDKVDNGERMGLIGNDELELDYKTGCQVDEGIDLYPKYENMKIENDSNVFTRHVSESDESPDEYSWPKTI